MRGEATSQEQRGAMADGQPAPCSGRHGDLGGVVVPGGGCRDMGHTHGPSTAHSNRGSPWVHGVVLLHLCLWPAARPTCAAQAEM